MEKERTFCKAIQRIEQSFLQAAIKIYNFFFTWINRKERKDKMSFFLEITYTYSCLFVLLCWSLSLLSVFYTVFFVWTFNIFLANFSSTFLKGIGVLSWKIGQRISRKLDCSHWLYSKMMSFLFLLRIIIDIL